MNKSRYVSTMLLFFILSVMMSCAINPVTRKPEFVLMSESQEIEIGREMDPKITEEYGYYRDETLQAYVNQLGQKLAGVCDRPDLNYQFKVVNSSMINAFALPGGYVYVTRGLLGYVNTEAELAGVLGHEIGHITARHAVRQYTKAQTYQFGILAASIVYPEISQLGPFADFVAMAIIQGYGRNNELQADRLGIKYSSATGYDPYCVSSFMKTLDNIEESTGKKGYHGLFSTHPETVDRIMKAKEEAKKIGPPSSGNFKQLREAYLSKIDGLMFGDDPKEGIVEGNTFKHPDLRITLTFPEGWTMNNAKDVLAAKHPEKEYFIQMTMGPLDRNVSAAEFAKKVATSYRLNQITGASKTINGFEAHVGTYQGTARDMGEIGADIATIRVEDNGYILMGISRPDYFGEALPFFTSTINSFKRLSKEEAERIKPHAIRIYTVKEGDTWKSIAHQFGQQPENAKTLALINALDPSRFPQPGSRIKVIAESP